MSERDAWFFRMKAATRELIKACGGIETAAAIAGYSVPQMGRLNNVGVDDLPSARLKSRLEAHAGEPIVSRVEVESLGWVVAVVETRMAEPGCLRRSTSAVVAEASDVIRVMAEQMTAGDLSPNMVSSLMKEMAELARAVEVARLNGSALLALSGGRRDE